MSNRAEEDFSLQVVAKLRAAGYEALWAGGCVRDVLMGNPVSDYDVATSASPAQVRKVFGRNATLMVGAAFGVVIVLGRTRQAGQVEVATFRTDASYSDGRHPDAVTFSTPEHDARRRDFTVNGMFFDPLANQLIDYVGGERDIRRRVIRAIGSADERLAEDKLRMLRAIRFAARLDFRIEPQTRAAIARHAAEINVVSGERIRSELAKILETGQAAWALQELFDVGLLPHILPEIAGDWPAHAVQVQQLLGTMSEASWLEKFATLLWPVTAGDSKRIQGTLSSLKHRLKFSNEECETLSFCLEVQAVLGNADGLPWSKVQPILTNRHIQSALRLLRARLADSHVHGETLLWLHAQLARPLAELDPGPWLMGEDLIQAGMQPGPEFRRLLDRARQMQLDGQLANRDAALNWLNETIR